MAQDNTPTSNRLDNIKVLRLLSGEDIIGEVTEGIGFVSVRKPVAVVLVPGRPLPNGAPGAASLQFSPWTPPYVIGEEVTLSNQVVMMTFKPQPQLAQEYYKVFIANIVLPPTGVQLLRS